MIAFLRAALAWALPVIVSGCATAPAGAPALREIALANPGFELDAIPGRNCATRWDCSAHSDPNAYAYALDEPQPGAGTRSLRIERVRNEPWGIIAQVVRDPALRGAKLRFSHAVRTEGVAGNGVGPFFQAHTGAGVSFGMVKRLATGSSPWKRLEVEFVVPREAVLFEVGALFEGGGKAWIDAVKLELVEPPAADKKPV